MYVLNFKLTEIEENAEVKTSEWKITDIELVHTPDMRETEKQHVSDEMVEFIESKLDITTSSQEYKLVLSKENDQGELEEVHEMTTTINNNRY